MVRIASNHPAPPASLGLACVLLEHAFNMNVCPSKVVSFSSPRYRRPHRRDNAPPAPSYLVAGQSGLDAGPGDIHLRYGLVHGLPRAVALHRALDREAVTMELVAPPLPDLLPNRCTNGLNRVGSRKGSEELALWGEGIAVDEGDKLSRTPCPKLGLDLSEIASCGGSSNAALQEGDIRENRAVSVELRDVQPCLVTTGATLEHPGAEVSVAPYESLS